MTKSKKSIFVQELYCRLFCNFQHIFHMYISLTFTQIFDLQSPFFYEATEMQTCLLKQQEIIFQPLQSGFSKSLYCLSLSWPIQGQSRQNGFFELALRDKYIPIIMVCYFLLLGNDPFNS